MGRWSEVAGWAEGESQTLGKWYRAGGARVGVIYTCCSGIGMQSWMPTQSVALSATVLCLCLWLSLNGIVRTQWLWRGDIPQLPFQKGLWSAVWEMFNSL